MTNLFLECLLWGLSCGIIGAVYREILPYENGFTKWWKVGAQFEGKKWYWKPIWGCAHCFAGQVALWSYFLLMILPAMVHAIRLNGWLYIYSVHYAKEGAAGLFCLILTISAAILSAKVLAWFIQKFIQ